MASHFVTKGVNTYTKRRVVVTMPVIDGNSILQQAINNNRAPTCRELLDESKSIIGVHLLTLRSGGDLYKSCNAICMLVKAIAAIHGIELVDDVSPEAISKMSDQELKDYASRLIDKIN